MRVETERIRELKEYWVSLGDKIGHAPPEVQNTQRDMLSILNEVLGVRKSEIEGKVSA